MASLADLEEFFKESVFIIYTVLVSLLLDGVCDSGGLPGVDLKF